MLLTGLNVVPVPLESFEQKASDAAFDDLWLTRATQLQHVCDLCEQTVRQGGAALLPLVGVALRCDSTDAAFAALGVVRRADNRPHSAAAPALAVRTLALSCSLSRRPSSDRLDLAQRQSLSWRPLRSRRL